MKKPSRLDYAYAVGRIRALERRLVSRPVFEEATEERNFVSAMKVIFEAGNYLEGIVQAKTVGDLENFLEQEDQNLFQLLSEIFLERDLLELYRREDSPGQALAMAERTGYPFFSVYFRHKVDLGNLKVFSRMKYSGLQKEKLNSLLLPGGFVEKSLILQSFDLSFEEMGEKLHATPYQKLWIKGADTLEEKETFIGFERGIEDFLMSYIKMAKQVVFGPEPVFAYALARKRELRLVRLVGLGKLNQIPGEILKERISETYV